MSLDDLVADRDLCFQLYKLGIEVASYWYWVDNLSYTFDMDQSKVSSSKVVAHTELDEMIRLDDGDYPGFNYFPAFTSEELGRMLPIFINRRRLRFVKEQTEFPPRSQMTTNPLYDEYPEFITYRVDYVYHGYFCDHKTGVQDIPTYLQTKDRLSDCSEQNKLSEKESDARAIILLWLISNSYPYITQTS